MSTKTKLEKPEKIVKIFDNPDYIDRYEFIIDNGNQWEYDVLTCNSNPESPQGVSQFGKTHSAENVTEKSISWNEVPENVQKHVIKRLS